MRLKIALLGLLWVSIFAIICAGYWVAKQDVHQLSDEDVFICEDSVKECKIYVTPETLKATGKNSFDVKVKSFFYKKLNVAEDTFSFWEEDGKIFYRAGDEGKPLEVKGDNSATAVWNYGLEFLKN